MDKSSIFKLSGMPDSFGVVLLSFSFILLLAPYFSGADFGVFKIPTFTQQAKRWFKIIGPILFLVCVVSFIPVFPTEKQITIGEAKPVPSPLSTAKSESSPPPDSSTQPSLGTNDSKEPKETVSSSETPTASRTRDSKVRDTTANKNSNAHLKIELSNKNVTQGSEVKHIKTQTWQALSHEPDRTFCGPEHQGWKVIPETVRFVVEYSEGKLNEVWSIGLLKSEPTVCYSVTAMVMFAVPHRIVFHFEYDIIRTGASN